MNSSLCQSRVIRAAELAKRLSISKATLWRWERKGRLPPKRQIGPNTAGWLEAELDEWFAKTDPPPPETSAQASKKGKA